MPIRVTKYITSNVNKMLIKPLQSFRAISVVVDVSEQLYIKKNDHEMIQKSIC